MGTSAQWTAMRTAWTSKKGVSGWGCTAGSWSGPGRRQDLSAMLRGVLLERLERAMHQLRLTSLLLLLPLCSLGEIVVACELCRLPRGLFDLAGPGIGLFYTAFHSSNFSLL